LEYHLYDILTTFNRVSQRIIELIVLYQQQYVIRIYQCHGLTERKFKGTKVPWAILVWKVKVPGSE